MTCALWRRPITVPLSATYSCMSIGNSSTGVVSSTGGKILMKRVSSRRDLESLTCCSWYGVRPLALPKKIFGTASAANCNAFFGEHASELQTGRDHAIPEVLKIAILAPRPRQSNRVFRKKLCHEFALGRQLLPSKQIPCLEQAYPPSGLLRLVFCNKAHQDNRARRSNTPLWLQSF